MHLPSLLQFLSGLHDNNSKSWFLHNKPHYDIIRAEFVEFVADLGARVQKFDRDLGLFEPKKAVFRLHRDVRFSKDKSPFKDRLGAVIGARTTDKTRPVYYFDIQHNGTLLIACGLYMPEKEVLKNIRDSIVSSPRAFLTMLKDKRFNEVYGGLSEEDRMMRPPKGFDADHPQIELLKNRHFICVTETNLTNKPPKDLAGWIAARHEAAYPLVKWLRMSTIRANAKTHISH